MVFAEFLRLLSIILFKKIVAYGRTMSYTKKLARLFFFYYQKMSIYDCASVQFCFLLERSRIKLLAISYFTIIYFGKACLNERKGIEKDLPI